jgi:hypothetical protein
MELHDTLADMDKQRLVRTLEQLRQELSQAERVEPETLAELEALTGEIRRALEGDESTEEVEPVSGLRDLLLKYEAEHPQVATAIGRVADALAAMGL